MNEVTIITFYEFRELADLESVKRELLAAMEEYSVLGTIIIADEGFNSTVSGPTVSIGPFVERIGRILGTTIRYKVSRHERNPFRRRFVKIKPEIVTLKKKVDIGLGRGTHVDARRWNELIRRGDVVVLDTRNDYEYRVGTFAGALNPETSCFSELPAFVDSALDPTKHRKVAMFCTGGIRCEKFAPYMKSLGFEEVYQLDGGILKYLEETEPGESLWHGECFVFDDRISVDDKLEKGTAADLSAASKSK